MKIYVQEKSMQQNNAMIWISLELSDEVHTVRELLTAFLIWKVKDYNQRVLQNEEIPVPVEKQQLVNQAVAGRINFGYLYEAQMIDQENAVQNGLQAYADGLVRVFQNGQALGNLDEGIQVEEDDHFILLRLVFLRGCL